MQKKPKMVPGEMTGKMMPLSERRRREDMMARELNAMKKERESKDMPTSTKRVVGVVMKGKSVNPSATKMVLKSIADRVAKARAKKGVQDEKYRK